METVPNSAAAPLRPGPTVGTLMTLDDESIRRFRETEAAHRTALALGAGWENITAFGAAIDKTLVVAIATDLYTILQAAAQASAGKTDLGVMLTDIVAGASPTHDPAAAGPIHEATLHLGGSTVRVRAESFWSAAGAMYYQLVLV
jgi:hypothetical protein